MLEVTPWDNKSCLTLYSTVLLTNRIGLFFLCLLGSVCLPSLYFVFVLDLVFLFRHAGARYIDEARINNAWWYKSSRTRSRARSRSKYAQNLQLQYVFCSIAKYYYYYGTAKDIFSPPPSSSFVSAANYAPTTSRGGLPGSESDQFGYFR